MVMSDFLKKYHHINTVIAYDIQATDGTCNMFNLKKKIKKIDVFNMSGIIEMPRAVATDE